MEKNNDRKITLHDYLMWIAEYEDNINAGLIRNELMLEMDDEDIMKFYEKYKNTELLHFKEKYEMGKYRETTVSFYLEGVEGGYFEIPDVYGSFLKDNGFIDNDQQATMKPAVKSMEEWAEELLDYYDSATEDEIRICAKHMAEFIETFLNKT